MPIKPETIQILKTQINVSRLRLMHLYDSHGQTDSEVLAAAVELDNLINEYEKLRRQL